MSQTTIHQISHNYLFPLNKKDGGKHIRDSVWAENTTEEVDWSGDWVDLPGTFNHCTYFLIDMDNVCTHSVLQADEAVEEVWFSIAAINNVSVWHHKASQRDRSVCL